MLRCLRCYALLQENNELAKLQAKAAMAAKARARVDEEERQTARWMQRLSYTEHELDKRSKMLATTSVEVDLFMSKTTKIMELQVESPEQSKRLFELIAQKKATGEIAADQDFRLISAADAVRLSSMGAFAQFRPMAGRPFLVSFCVGARIFLLRSFLLSLRSMNAEHRKP
eukprot:COSAG02_NODE_9977_length_2059_cov_1.283673_1_plen_171_part_00